MSQGYSDKRRIRLTVLPLLCILAAMGMLMYYAVPLYNMFCQVTGIGGTTQRAAAAAVDSVEREMKVRFSTEVHPDLPWTFRPEQKRITVDLGEPTTVYFLARNHSDRTIVGHAAYNVTPLKVGRYINKVECFCFTEERLHAGESVRMPVQLFVDPLLAEDDSVNEVKTITMSYTFFESKDPEGAKDLNRLDASKQEASVSADGADG